MKLNDWWNQRKSQKIIIFKKFLFCLKFLNCKCINLYCWRQLLYERISQFLPFDMNYETSFPLEEICYIIWLQMLALYIFCRVQSITSTTLVFMNLSNLKNMFQHVNVGINLSYLVYFCPTLYKLVQTCSMLYRLVQTCSNHKRVIVFIFRGLLSECMNFIKTFKSFQSIQ